MLSVLKWVIQEVPLPLAWQMKQCSIVVKNKDLEPDSLGCNYNFAMY